MIEVVTLTGRNDVIDRAETDTPEAAILAARTLLTDAREHGTHGATASFYDGDGHLIRSRVTPTDLGVRPVYQEA